MKTDLFNENEMPFNLAGELIDNGITAEGEARVRALAESEARKAQRDLFRCHNGHFSESLDGYEKSNWRHCPYCPAVATRDL